MSKATNTELTKQLQEVTELLNETGEQLKKITDEFQDYKSKNQLKFSNLEQLIKLGLTRNSLLEKDIAFKMIANELDINIDFDDIASEKYVKPNVFNKEELKAKVRNPQEFSLRQNLEINRKKAAFAEKAKINENRKISTDILISDIDKNIEGFFAIAADIIPDTRFDIDKMNNMDLIIVLELVQDFLEMSGDSVRRRNLLSIIPSLTAG